MEIRAQHIRLMAEAPRQNRRSLTMWTRVLCILALTHISAAVIVKVGDYTFPLETVKKLREVVDGLKWSDPNVQRDDITSYEGICNNRALPELRGLCDTKEPGLIAETLRALELVADKADECEICAFVACSGC